MQLDAVTVLCTTLTLYGGYAQFVSSKPVTLGGIVLIAILALSTTQALVGFARTWGQAAPVEEKHADVLDMMKWVLSQARGSWA